jgi:dienelactone hydrolase
MKSRDRDTVRVCCLSLLLSVALCLRLEAQEDGGILRLRQAGMEIGRETFRETGHTLETDVTIPLLKLRIAATTERDDAGRAQRIEERIFSLPADTLVRTYTATIVGDSVHVTLGSREWTKGGAPEDISADQTLASFVRLVQRANRRDRTVRVWLPSADTTLPVVIAFRGDTASVTIGPQVVTFSLGADGKVRSADFPQSRVHYERHVAGTELPPLAGMNPPAADYSAPAGASWTAEDVRVTVRGLRADTFSLGCTLTKPKQGAARLPAAITLTGSGQQDRDENLWPLVPDYHLFRQVASRLGDAGIAVLRCDDYGAGSSGGAVDTAVSMLDFANAAEAQLAWLRARPDIDGAKLAIIGHSEGGIVGPMVAARDPRLAALVVMAGPSKPMGAVLRDQFLSGVERAEGLTPEQRAQAREQAVRDADAFGGNAPGYMRHARAHDPLATARQVRAPTLILQGALDRQVSHGQADTLGAAMRAAGNRDVTVRTFDRLNHLFLVSANGTGSPDEYATLRDVAVPADVLDTLADWLRRKLR